MKEEKPHIIQTKDGSNSLYLAGLDETYHSTHGALQEAQHVFIKSGTDFFFSQNPKKESIRIFEMGLGTGLNAILSMEYSEISTKKVYYTTIEAFPLQWELVKQLHYAQDYPIEIQDAYKKMHLHSWDGQAVDLLPHFNFKRVHTTLEEYDIQEVYDIIYYDAFAPRKQEELWSLESLRKVCDALVEGGVFVTYSAFGQMKRNLKALHMEVSSIPGPPGKREMVRAIKKSI